MSNRTVKSFFTELVSVFIAILLAFALNSWNENRKEKEQLHTILLEMKNGLQQDLHDMEINVKGHETGLEAIQAFRKYVLGDSVGGEELAIANFYLNRDFISIQNGSAYESLKALGLNLVKDDSLRLQIIKVYDFDFEVLRKLEEEYDENQMNRQYFSILQPILSKRMVFSDKGMFRGFVQPGNFSNDEKQTILQILFRNENNRRFTMAQYAEVEKEVKVIAEKISAYLDAN